MTPAVTTAQTPTDSWRPPWPAGTAAALVVGGSAGIGNLEATAHDVLGTGLMTPVVACGTNERLRRRLDAVPGIVALGWRDDMVALVASARCVIQNAGGMTSLEALAARTPTLTYRAIPGHGVTNAEALVTAGLAVWPQDAAQLETALAGVLTAPPVRRPAGSGSGREATPERAVAPTVVEVLCGAGLLGQPDRVPVAA